jgi:hypothetical protein
MKMIVRLIPNPADGDGLGLPDLSLDGRYMTYETINNDGPECHIG